MNRTVVGFLAALLTFSSIANATLVNHWPADGNTTDVSGGNDGSATNVSYVAGQLGQAFSFDGTSQIAIDPKALALGTGDFSLAFWVQTTSETGAILDLCGDNTLNCSLTLQGRLALALLDTNGVSGVAVTVQKVNDGTFHHVVAERKATDLMIYVDGVLAAYNPGVGIADLSTNYSVYTDPDTLESVTNQSVATLGGNACDDSLVGALDDIRIYNTALDANEAYLLVHPDSKLAIVTQPFNQRTLANHTVVFNVVGVGLGPITYQWQLNGHDIPGAVGHYYQIDSVQASDAGTYSAVVSNPYTNLVSAAATLFVTNAPSLDQYLISRWSGEGTTRDDIKGTTSPYANLSYVPGVLGTAFQFNEKTSVDCGNVFGPLGFDDFTYEFWVKTRYDGYAEAIMSQRQYCNAVPMFELQWDATRHFVSWQFAGDRSSFIMATSGGVPVTLNDGVFHHIAAVRKGNAITLFIDGIRGATSMGPAADMSLLPPNLILGHSCCDYDMQVPFTGMLDEISLYHRALSDAEIFSTYQPNPSLLIVTQPKSTETAEGMPATMSVAVTGQEPYSFQWSLQGTDIPGATDSVLNISSTPLSAAGDYSVKVSNATEHVTSALAHLSVVPANTILPGLVHKWSGEGNGVDYIGGSYLAALNSSFAPGVVGQAFSFNGEGDLVAFTHVHDFGTNDFTVDFWERATSSRYAVLVARPDCYRVMYLGNDVSFELFTDLGAFSVQTTGQHLGDGQYHHVACVRQDTNLLVYVDGVVAGTNSYPAIGMVNTSIYGFEIVDDVGRPTRFGGQIDEVELYSRALSGSEISGIYSAVANGPRAVASPKYINTLVGNPVTLTLPSISGTGPFTYQWQLNGVNIPGRTGTTFATTLTLDGAGVYTCVVTGPGGSTTIPVGTVSIQLPADSYNGLFYFDGAPDDDTSGYITLKVTENQTYSGSLRQHGSPNVGFSGKFVANRSVAVLSGGRSVSLIADASGGEVRLKGIVRKNGKNIPLLATRAIYSAARPTPQAGAYTLSLQGQNSATAPNGDGFGNVTISPNGKIKFGATLADNTPVTQGAALATSGTWPLYCQLAGGRGSVLGWLSFTNSPGTRCFGDLRWIKSAGGANYQQGFAAKLSVVGSAFHPHAGDLGINVNGGSMVLSGGKLPANIVKPIVGTGLNTIVCQNDSSTAKLQVKPTLGTFSGKIVQDGTTVTVKGITMQDQSVATGYFIRNGVSGRVQIGH